MEDKTLEKIALRIWSATVQQLQREYGTAYSKQETVTIAYSALFLTDYIFYNSPYINALQRRKIISADADGVRIEKRYLKMTATEFLHSI